MTANQFAHWLNGCRDMIGPDRLPTEVEWVTIIDALSKVSEDDRKNPFVSSHQQGLCESSMQMNPYILKHAGDPC